MANGISVSTDAMPLVAKLFGVQFPEETPKPQPTKLDALRSLINPAPVQETQPSPVLPNVSPAPLPPETLGPDRGVQDSGVTPTFREAHPKLAFLLKGLMNTAINAGPGIGAPTFGQGFATAAAQPSIRAKREMETAQARANLQRTNAETYALQHPPVKAADYDLKEVTSPDGNPALVRVNKLTGEIQPIAGISPKLAESQQPMRTEKISQINSLLADRYAVLHPGQDVPAQYQLKTGATQKDFDSLDKVMQQTESAAGTKAQRDTVNAMRQQTMEIARQARADRAAQRQSGETDLSVLAHALATDMNGLTVLKDVVSMRGDQRIKVFAMAKRENPNFDPGVAQNRLRFVEQFTNPNGKTSLGIDSANTFLQHAADLLDITGQFRSTNIPAINAPLNKLRNLAGDSSYSQYKAALDVVRTEYVNAVKAGFAPQTEDSKEGRDIMSESASPAQVEAATKQMAHTISRRLDSTNEKYRTVMGQNYPNLYTPEGRDGAVKLGLGHVVTKYMTGGQVGKTDTLPKALADQIQEGHQATMSDGSVWQKTGGIVTKIK